MSSLRAGALALATLLASASARAQVIRVDPSARVGEVPDAPGRGVPVRWVHGFFPGYPFHIEDARDLLDERAVVPAFDTWCGTLPGIDLGNGTVADSLGRSAPSLICAPFLDATQTPEVSCRRLPHLPTGRYWRNGGAAMRAQGALAVRRAGVYTFAWGHDDGVSFRVAATRIYEFPDGTGARVDLAAVSFEQPGLYPFTLEWFDGIGGAVLDWYIAEGERRPGEFSNFTFTLVSPTDLYPLGEQDCTARCEPCGAGAPICDRERGRCVACTETHGCGRCARCVDGGCEPDPARPGCRQEAHGDAGAVREPLDAGPLEDASDIGVRAAPESPRGCACRSRPERSGGAAVAWLLAAVVGSRRRRR